MLLEVARIKEAHSAIHRFWQNQIEDAQSQKDDDEGKTFWLRQIEAAKKGQRNFAEAILRDFGADYVAEITTPEWHALLDFLC